MARMVRFPSVAGLSPRRRVLVGVLVLAILAVVLVGGVVVAIRVLRGDPVPDTIDQARPGPVLLVPGYGGSQAALDVLAARLRTLGREATVVNLPDNGNGDLTTQADALDAAARKALRAGAPSVDVIGYSAGGVVVRLWVDRYDTARATRRIVTLGSPLHGASIAGVGAAVVPGACPTACQQLAPGSGLLSELDAAVLPAGLPWLSVWTRNDETVTPPESAQLEGAVNVAVQDICADASVQHGQLPTDPLVTGLIRRALTSLAPLTTAPGRSDCASLRRADP
jgi:triacylglycerol lipase